MAFRPLVGRLSRSSLIWRLVRGPRNIKQLSQSAERAAFPSKLPRTAFYLLAGLGSCAVTVWGLNRLSLHVLPVAKAGGKGKGTEEKPKKISARELRYKSFASYVYKGEPYMSARDFLESLIRDEPRCTYAFNDTATPTYNMYMLHVPCTHTLTVSAFFLFFYSC